MPPDGSGPRLRGVRTVAAEGDLAGLRVLVIEDDFYLALDEQRALEKAGAIVAGPCPDPAEGLALIEREPVDCAVLDVNLGSGPSFEVAAALRAKGIPFVFVTGYDPCTIPAEFADVERLEKPVDFGRLIRALARVRTSQA